MVNERFTHHAGFTVRAACDFQETGTEKSAPIGLTESGKSVDYLPPLSARRLTSGLLYGLFAFDFLLPCTRTVLRIFPQRPGSSFREALKARRLKMVGEGQPKDS